MHPLRMYGMVETITEYLKQGNFLRDPSKYDSTISYGEYFQLSVLSRYFTRQRWRPFLPLTVLFLLYGGNPRTYYELSYKPHRNGRRRQTSATVAVSTGDPQGNLESLELRDETLLAQGSQWLTCLTEKFETRISLRQLPEVLFPAQFLTALQELVDWHLAHEETLTSEQLIEMRELFEPKVRPLLTLNAIEELYREDAK